MSTAKISVAAESTASYMNAAVVTEYGKPNDVLSVRSDVRTKPSLVGATKAEQTKLDRKILVKVHAVSLSPGDCRLIAGEKSLLCKPSFWPYIPAGDICGTVAEVPANAEDSPFQVGDWVVATWNAFGEGGLAEYALVDRNMAAIKPPSIRPVLGAALANSATHARNAVQLGSVKNGDRVLILGGSGGVGSLAIQYARRAGASYVAATSTDTALLQRVGVDRAIQYEKENWWEIEEYRREKFDVIIDCAVGKAAFEKSPEVLKGKNESGRFVAVVLNEWHIDAKTFTQLVTFLMGPLGRQLFNIFRRTTPSYHMYIGEVNGKDIEEVLGLVEKGELQVPIDAKSPHPFATEGVRDAFNHQASRRGHGKIVVQLE